MRDVETRESGSTSTKIPCMEHLVTGKGLKPDPEKIIAVSNMPIPGSVSAVRRFCRFVNYLAKFLPNLSVSDVLNL